MIQDCYIEEIKDIVKEKKLHMSEQELYFAEREMQKNIIEYNMNICSCLECNWKSNYLSLSGIASRRKRTAYNSNNSFGNPWMFEFFKLYFTF